MLARQTRHSLASSPVSKVLARFAKDEEGGLIVFSLLVLVSMLVLGGMAVDFMRQENERIVLQGVVDRSVLAAASLQQERPGEDVVEDYFLKSGYDGQLKGPPEAIDSGNNRRVSVDAQGEIDTFFLRLVGIDTLSANASASAIEAVGKVEISLVIDVSGSMRQQGSNPRVTIDTLDTGGRIYDLRNAAKEFANTVLDPAYDGEISLTIVPYAGHTNPGQDMLEIINGSPVNVPGDAEDNFTVPFDAMMPGIVEYNESGAPVGIPITSVAFDDSIGGFVLIVQEGLVDSIPDITQITASATYSGPYDLVDTKGNPILIEDGSGVLQTVTNEDIKKVYVNRQDDDGNYLPFTRWEVDQAEVDGLDWVIDPGANTTLQVVYNPPHACMELLDAANWTSTAPPAAGQPKVPQFMHWGYSDWEVKNELMGFGWCPHNDTAISYAMQDRDIAVAYIDELRLFDGTGTQNAMKWGVATLDPGMQPHFQALHNRNPDLLPADFVNRPAAFDDDETRKMLVLMTDGRVTAQYRPKVGEETRIGNLLNLLPTNLKEHNHWIGDNIQGSRAREVVSQSVARDTQLVGMCNLAKDQGIVIYTVAFEFPQPGDDNYDSFASNRNAMQDCANEVPEGSDEQYYFEAEGSDLTEVFKDIAEQVSDLRLTR